LEGNPLDRRTPVSDIRYIVVRPDGSHTRALRGPRAVARVRKYAKDIGPDWRIRRRGEPNSEARGDLDQTMERFRSMLEVSDVGERLILDGERGKYNVAVIVVELKPPLMQTAGNSKIDAIYTYVVRTFKVRNGGICNRRVVAGTTTWSQHSPWPPPDEGSNAVDFFAYPDTMSQLFKMADAIVAEAKRGDLAVGRVIVGDRQWTPAASWHDYGGEYHRHLHCEGSPTRSGLPRGAC
jgi:hypothetical protein